MKHWSALLLLVLLPFTMAPRTSLTPDADILEIQGNVSRDRVRVGQPVSVMFQVHNVSDDVASKANLLVEVGLVEGSSRAPVAVRAASGGCVVQDDQMPVVISCPLGDLAAGQQKTVSVTLSLAGEGGLTIDPMASWGAFTISLQPIDEPITVRVGNPRR